MDPDRWPFVPIALGSVLLTGWAANCHGLATSVRDDDWWLIARVELSFLVGLWLLCGVSRRWARVSALTFFVGILACDLVRAVAGYPPRPALGHVAIRTWGLFAGDLVIIISLLWWRPTGGTAWVGSHPGRLAGVALMATALGIALDWSGVGSFPIVATSRAGGSPPSRALNYLVYLPEGYYRSSGRWPLLLYLHGSSLLGRDIARLRGGGLPRRVEAGLSLRFIMVAPQSPRPGWDVESLDALVGEVLGRYPADPDRVYLTGQSMGGYGTWELAAAHPERFAAIAPICGGGDPVSAERLRGVPTWAFHGADDTVVRPEQSLRMVAALQRAGGDVKLTVYPGVGHEAATPTYADRRLYDWFLAHRRRAR